MVRTEAIASDSERRPALNDGDATRRRSWCRSSTSGFTDNTVNSVSSRRKSSTTTITLASVMEYLSPSHSHKKPNSLERTGSGAQSTLARPRSFRRISTFRKCHSMYQFTLHFSFSKIGGRFCSSLIYT